MTVRTYVYGVCVCCVLSLIAGCAAVPYEPSSGGRELPSMEPVRPSGEEPIRPSGPVTAPPTAEPEAPEVPPRRPAPQTIAALQLTRQAEVLLDSKRPDDAIRLLERALNIDPANGQCYYYLAEAWLMKGERKRALEFNRIAAVHFTQDDPWMGKVRLQKEKIIRP